MEQNRNFIQTDTEEILYSDTVIIKKGRSKFSEMLSNLRKKELRIGFLRFIGSCFIPLLDRVNFSAGLYSCMGASKLPNINSYDKEF